MLFRYPAWAKPQGASYEDFAADEFRPRTEPYIALAAPWRDRETLRAECDRIRRRAPRRCEALEAIALFNPASLTADGEAPRRLLPFDGSLLAALRKAGYITVAERERRVERSSKAVFDPPRLTPAQQRAADEIRASWRDGKAVHLLR